MRYLKIYNSGFGFFFRDNLVEDAVKFQSWEFLQTHFKDRKDEWETKQKNANHGVGSQVMGPMADKKIGKVDTRETFKSFWTLEECID